MEFEVSYSLEDEQQFWDELDEIVNTSGGTSQLIDNNLLAYLGFVADYQDEYLKSASDWARCSYIFLSSPLFINNKPYIRQRLIGCLRKENANPRVYLTATILLFDGRENQKTFETMQAEELFPRMLELISEKRSEGDQECRNRLFELLYEMSRVQRLRWEDLAAIDDWFMTYLFELVEEQANVDDPYHYVVIKVLLVLNEQYMVSAHASPPDRENSAAGQEVLTNKVMKILCFRMDDFKTFGENIILLLNRETETSLQLLILKVVYLLCTTSATYEYFYRNDLYVLVDVVIRNLLDLPDDAESLRHTYLRVLYPLLANTQLRYPPFYKRDELLMLFSTLSSIRSSHFQPVDETTVRLVTRCANVPWLLPTKEPKVDGEGKESGDKLPTTNNGDIPTDANAGDPGDPKHESNKENEGEMLKPLHYRPVGQAAVLGMSLAEAKESSMELAAVAEKPGVMAPSRSRAASSTIDALEFVRGPAPPPPPPPPTHTHPHLNQQSSPLPPVSASPLPRPPRPLPPLPPSQPSSKPSTPPPVQYSPPSSYPETKAIPNQGLKSKSPPPPPPPPPPISPPRRAGSAPPRAPPPPPNPPLLASVEQAVKMVFTVRKARPPPPPPPPRGVTPPVRINNTATAVSGENMKGISPSGPIGPHDMRRCFSASGISSNVNGSGKLPPPVPPPPRTKRTPLAQMQAVQQYPSPSQKAQGLATVHTIDSDATPVIESGEVSGVNTVAVNTVNGVGGGIVDALN